MIKEQLFPHEVPQAACILGHALTMTTPQVACAILGGAIANMVGHIPDAFWEQMKAEVEKPCECGDPACNQKMKQSVYKALDELRNQWKQIVGPEPTNPDEKEIQE